MFTAPPPRVGASATPAERHWSVEVDGRRYQLFEARVDDVRDESLTRLVEDRIHGWYTRSILGEAKRLPVRSPLNRLLLGVLLTSYIEPVRRTRTAGLSCWS